VKPDSACALAIVVDGEGVTIGTSAGACRAARVDGKPDVTWVEAELRQLRWALAECSANTVVVAEKGPYHEVIGLMDIAIKTGFVDVAVGDASDVPFAVGAAHDDHCKLPTPPKKPVAPPVAPMEDEPLSPLQAFALAVKLREQTPLPLDSGSDQPLQHAPAIIVTKSEITFQGELMASVDAVARDPKALEPLAERLHAEATTTRHKLATGGFAPEVVKACDDARRGIRPLPGRICPDGLAILQADQDTDMRVINAVLKTAMNAGFDNVLFAVKNI
jgi:biopolymer transport protein ExbD